MGEISTGMKETKYIDVVQYSNFIIVIISVHVMLILYFIIYVTASKPEKHVLLRLLSSITAKWQEMGDLLGVDPDTIKGLCDSNFSNQVKMSKMLQSWLDNEPTPATWNNIISVIEGPLQKKSLADDIRQLLLGI